MNRRMVVFILGWILKLEALFLLLPLLVGLLYREFTGCLCFLITIAVCGLAGVLIARKKPANTVFYMKEGCAATALGWILLSITGALPFYLSREIPSYTDALFETISGFTTTGASVLPEVESLSYCMLFWRSFTHWLGGMGVLVFLLAISSTGGNGFTMHLLRAESPGPNVGKLVPKMKTTARILYMLYIVLTLLDVVFLLLGGMSPFESVCTALGTAGTGGFGVRNDSIASYSPYLQNVCTVFMFLFGVNFTCYYLLILKKFYNVFKDEELRLYFGMVLGSIALIVWNLKGYYSTLGETVRHAAFQVVSVVTTTGFATTDFDLWPNFSKTILLCLMVVGACAGSTGGGFKCIRILLVMKNLRRNVQKVLHPQKVQVVRINGQPVAEKILDNTNAYLAAYTFIFLFSFILISIDNFSVTTNFSAVMACFNNIGPGLEAVGPTCNFGAYSIFSKIVLIVDMLAGRLEIFPILILFSRSAWKHR